jgi:hypothetical protein
MTHMSLARSNNLGADFDLSPRDARTEASGDKTFSPLATRRAAATASPKTPRLDVSGKMAPTNPPPNVEAVISPFKKQQLTQAAGPAAVESTPGSLASTRGSVRFFDSSSEAGGGVPENSVGGSDLTLQMSNGLKVSCGSVKVQPDFNSTSYRCGSFDPRVPPPMLGRVQPLVTGGAAVNPYQRAASQLFPALPAAGCPLLQVRNISRPYGGDRLQRPWACDAA